jgi:4-amino-4-deoxy-L-arabinose transferase-like glycosyltransferase
MEDVHKRKNSASTSQPARKISLDLLVIGCISLFYWVTHLWNLTLLPVFADESIYIRWSQLIMDDWARYLFFPLNDGKTPLFIWALIPWQYLFSDQLFASRFFAVVIGFGQLFAIKYLVRELGGRKGAQWLAMFLTTVLPFWFFHHHMALMDGLMTLFLTLTLVGIVQVVQLKDVFKNRSGLIKIALTGLAFGLAIWTKLPAIFLVTCFPFAVFLDQKTTSKQKLQSLFAVAAVGCIAIGLLATLRISPAFGQLFRRTQDFTYPLNEVLLQGKWMVTLRNIPSYIWDFIMYLTLPLMIFAVSGLFSNRVRRQTGFLLLAGVLFCAPFVILGKTIYPRYLFAFSLFVTVAASLSLQAIYDRWLSEQAKKPLWVKAGVSACVALLLAQILTQSSAFMLHIMFSPSQTPFVRADREQYLEEWSAGYGNKETVEFIKAQAKNHSIAVATEGRFGTLPDGLLLYFHGQNVENVYIEGTGQYPVKDIPSFFSSRAKKFTQSILVVNSHRMAIHLPPSKLINEYCRPHAAPCLQVWDITDLVQKTP